MITREQIQAAIDTGKPFHLRTADGQQYDVPHRDYVSFPPKGFSVIIHNDTTYFWILPLRNLTGLNVSAEIPEGE
jgi:hypothetical protein